MTTTDLTRSTAAREHRNAVRAKLGLPKCKLDTDPPRPTVIGR